MLPYSRSSFFFFFFLGEAEKLNLNGQLGNRKYDYFLVLTDSLLGRKFSESLFEIFFLFCFFFFPENKG